MGRAQRDIIGLGVISGAVILFVGTGASVLPQLARVWSSGGLPPDRLLITALLLNIALIIFGWRRYAELTREIEERRKAEESAFKMAQTDALTGCLNRRSIGPACDALVQNCIAQDQAAAVMMLDLDNFKLVNDINGHQVGDEILIQAANRIRALLPKNALLARLGGDEFACVVPFERDAPATMDNLAARIIDRLAEPVQLEKHSVEITISIGIVRSDHPDIAVATDSPTLLHLADIGMYHAKKRGRNRYFWFESAMETELRFRTEFEAGIRRGITNGEFVPYYEQQIDLTSGRLVGFEMLARWKSPQFGLVNPEVFIPIAEEIGVIANLSEQLIARALVDARDWDPSLKLSVNISPIQLRDPWFAQKLLKILVAANFPPSRLDVEITESCLHENMSVVRNLVGSLKNQGVTISLDDFGTGYSSLSQLRSLPFDRLKIDRSFVTNLMESHDSSTIVEAITSLGNGMNLPITAEGIETAEVLEKLRGLGNFNGQGYLYGRPIDASDVANLLTEKGLECRSPGSVASAITDEPVLPEPVRKHG